MLKFEEHGGTTLADRAKGTAFEILYAPRSVPPSEAESEAESKAAANRKRVNANLKRFRAKRKSKVESMRNDKQYARWTIK